MGSQVPAWTLPDEIDGMSTGLMMRGRCVGLGGAVRGEALMRARGQRWRAQGAERERGGRPGGIAEAGRAHGGAQQGGGTGGRPGGRAEAGTWPRLCHIRHKVTLYMQVAEPRRGVHIRVTASWVHSRARMGRASVVQSADRWSLSGVRPERAQ